MWDFKEWLVGNQPPGVSASMVNQVLDRNPPQMTLIEMKYMKSSSHGVTWHLLLQMRRVKKGSLSLNKNKHLIFRHPDFCVWALLF